MRPLSLPGYIHPRQHTLFTLPACVSRHRSLHSSESAFLPCLCSSHPPCVLLPHLTPPYTCLPCGLRVAPGSVFLGMDHHPHRFSSSSWIQQSVNPYVTEYSQYIPNLVFMSPLLKTVNSIIPVKSSNRPTIIISLQ